MNQFDLNKVFDDYSKVMDFIDGPYFMMMEQWSNAHELNQGLKIIEDIIYNGVKYIIDGKKEESPIQKYLDDLLKDIENGEDSSKQKSKGKKTTELDSFENITTA